MLLSKIGYMSVGPCFFKGTDGWESENNVSDGPKSDNQYAFWVLFTHNQVDLALYWKSSDVYLRYLYQDPPRFRTFLLFRVLVGR